MNLLVTNSYFGTPMVWEYDKGFVSRFPLEDFNVHIMLMEGDQIHYTLPVDLFDKIINYVMEIRLCTRNLAAAFRLCTINKRTCKMFYNQIYGARYDYGAYESGIYRSMLYKLSKTFCFAEAIYDDYLASPNNTSSGLVAITAYRNGSLRYNPIYDPWDFSTNQGLTLQQLTIDEDDVFFDMHIFPGQFYGDTIWIQGTEEEGIYAAKKIHHPIVLLILADFTFSLIPTRRSINKNWRNFAKFLRRSYGENTGIYIMVKHQQDSQNPFIETTDIFAEI